MALSNDLINQFVKATNDNSKSKSETIVYGNAKKVGDTVYVQLDGSDLLTPVSTTANIRDNERVIVMIKNHTATITGNITSPSANNQDIDDAIGDVAEFETVLAKKVDTEYANSTYATITNLNATNVKVRTLESSHGAFVTLASENFNTINANIDNLGTKYANIDFTNIGKAAMEYFYTNSGLIKDVKIGDATITGKLVGVTIVGDLLEGNTVVADKLVIKGEDGLYYKLNTDGMAVSAEQTDYNSLNGKIIRAKSVTAEKIAVDDLVAFDATIGGFNITDSSLYSGVKESIDDGTAGIYMDKNGQMAIGDGTQHLKYYKDSDGNYILDISVTNLSIKGIDIQNGINNAAKTATNFVEYDSTNGLQVGNKTTGSWSGFRTQITNAAFNILNAAGTVLASYGEKIIELGKNATDAIIKLCGGKGKIEYVTDDDTSDEYLQMYADKIRMKSSEMSSVYSMYTDNSTRWEKSAVNVTPTQVGMYASECIDPTLHDMLEGWNTTEFNVNPDGIDMYSPGNMNLHSSTIVNDNGEMLTATYGSSGIWKYKKWSNGDVELWGTYSVSDIACTTALGGWYRTAVFSPGSFPFTVYNPNVTANYESDGYGAMLWATTTATQSKLPSYYLIRPTSATIASGKINFHVYGKWTN